jgi:dihydropteroate synthase
MKIMGIVNAGPDSFSDEQRPGSLAELESAARALVEQGADIVDVGGESGVTYTDVTPPEVEIERVVPLVRALAAQGIVVSVDTWKAPVAAAALEAGASIINDVSGLRDPELAGLVAGTGARLVVMHTRAEPKERRFPDYGGDVVGDVVGFLEERCELARARGVADSQLILDPGPDFAKSPQETVEALQAIDRLRALHLPWLAAVSRKYFLGAITGREPADRLAATLAAVGWAADAGAAIVRVHDVAAVSDYLAVRAVLAGEAQMPAYDDGDERLMWIRQDRGVGSDA